MGETLLYDARTDPPASVSVFERIAAEVADAGYSLQTLDEAWVGALAARGRTLSAADFHAATIGRHRNQIHDGLVRRDEIHWLDGEDAVERDWLDWCERLRATINQHLFLGLFSYECHFAHYPPGAFYTRHVDAFRGEANRVLSTVLYLNPEWSAEDGGELLLHAADGDATLQRVVPRLGTLAVFLSEAFPHEVLPARRDRYSIAGWFRVNASTAARIDPPR